MAAHNELGKEGEEAASAYLSSRGYRIRHRNWHVGKLELDIIAEKDGELIVVEVKTRRNTRFGLPATDAYVKRFAIDLPVRFDIITVTGIQPPFSIEHIEGAFLSPVW